ncbi:hypothetical protein M5K25_021901 [Dendrobium thyrsiflorum]|uniref:Uncharacterized protein n=1 Tax=Dendrobium thyrsiflorum TaxID=117978 RepID=A0ABD0U575_DENTH
MNPSDVLDQALALCELKTSAGISKQTLRRKKKKKVSASGNKHKKKKKAVLGTDSAVEGNETLPQTEYGLLVKKTCGQLERREPESVAFESKQLALTGSETCSLRGVNGSCCGETFPKLGLEELRQRAPWDSVERRGEIEVERRVHALEAIYRKGKERTKQGRSESNDEIRSSIGDRLADAEAKFFDLRVVALEFVTSPWDSCPRRDQS